MATLSPLRVGQFIRTSPAGNSHLSFVVVGVKGSCNPPAPFAGSQLQGFSVCSPQDTEISISSSDLFKNAAELAHFSSLKPHRQQHGQNGVSLRQRKDNNQEKAPSPLQQWSGVVSATGSAVAVIEPLTHPNRCEIHVCSLLTPYVESGMKPHPS